MAEYQTKKTKHAVYNTLRCTREGFIWSKRSCALENSAAQKDEQRCGWHD